MRYVILSLISGRSVELLAEKCRKKGPTDVVLGHFTEDGTLIPISNEDIAKLSALSGEVCIYLHGHGAQGCGVFGNEKEQTITDEILAGLITDNILPAKISKLIINIIACYAASSSAKDKSDSLAERLMPRFNKLGIKNIEVTASEDLVSIQQHPTTREIFVLREGSLEFALREQYKQSRMKALTEIKSDFIWGHLSLNLPSFLENHIGFFAHRNLHPEFLLSDKLLSNFIGKLCEYMLDTLNQKGSIAENFMTAILALMVIKERLHKSSRNTQSIEFDNSLKQLKNANHSRRGAKMMFASNDGNISVSDHYERKYKKLGSKY